jgi:hypothetical protein
MSASMRNLIYAASLFVPLLGCGGEVPWQILPNPDQPRPTVSAPGFNDMVMDRESVTPAVLADVARTEIIAKGEKTELTTLVDEVPEASEEDEDGEGPPPIKDPELDLDFDFDPEVDLAVHIPLLTIQPFDLPEDPTTPAEADAPVFVKFGDEPARWLALYELTGHALEQGGAILEASTLLDPSDIDPADGSDIITTRRVASHPEIASTGEATMVRTVTYVTQGDSVGLKNDLITITFDHFQYHHSCVGKLEVTGTVICGGHLASTATPGAFDGLYLCANIGGAIEVKAVNYAHPITFFVTQAIAGPLQAPTSHGYAGKYTSHGVPRAFPATVPTGLAICAVQ